MLKIIKAIRPINLLIIALTQWLIYKFVVLPVFDIHLFKRDIAFWLLMLATIFATAGGNIINDYYDIAIDRINKPGKNLFETQTNKRFGLIIYFIITGLSIVFGFLNRYPTIGYLVLGVNVLLWIYSYKFKQRMIIGTITVAFLSSLAVFIPCLLISEKNFNLSTLLVPLLLSCFAFLISLSRELIKDIEDLEGDRLGNCKTLPLVIGVVATKRIAGAIVLISSIALLTLLLVYLNEFILMVYFTLFLILPLIIIFHRILKSKSSDDFHKVSQYLKLIMIPGILTIVIIYYLGV